MKRGIEGGRTSVMAPGGREECVQLLYRGAMGGWREGWRAQWEQLKCEEGGCQLVGNRNHDPRGMEGGR